MPVLMTGVSKVTIFGGQHQLGPYTALSEVHCTITILYQHLLLSGVNVVWFSILLNVRCLTVSDWLVGNMKDEYMHTIYIDVTV